MKEEEKFESCPAENLMKMLSGKWKINIFRFAVNAPVRFSFLLKNLEGASKQSLTLALKELESNGLLLKETIQLKPLHIEYSLTEKGKSLIPIFEQLESIAVKT